MHVTPNQKYRKKINNAEVSEKCVNPICCRFNEDNYKILH